DDSHDVGPGKLRSELAEADAFSERVAVWEEAFDESFVHNHNARRLVIVGAFDKATLEERNPHSGEPSRCGLAILRVWHVRLIARLVTFDLDQSIGAIAVERNHVGCACGGDARQLVQSRQRAIEKAHEAILIGSGYATLRNRERDAQRQRMICPESWVYTAQKREASQHESRADQQHTESATS